MAIFSLLLQLLKIILYIVLALLALVLLIVLLITFVPVSYKLDMQWKEGLAGQATAAWLFGAAGVAVELDSKQVMPRIFGFTLARGRKKKPPEPAPEKDSPAVKPEPEKSREAAKPTFEKSHKAGGAKNADAQADKPHGEKKEKTGMIDGFKEMLNKWESVREIPDKKDLLNQALALCKRIFRLVKPKVLRLRGRIGFEEPHLTGYAVGTAFALQGISGWDIQLEGEFENKTLELELMAKGRVWAGLAAWNALFFALKAWLKYKKYFKELENINYQN